jgi:uncharacterized C2H2 Zn-finger protein
MFEARGDRARPVSKSWLERLREYGVSEEEFNRFCESYPQFKSNRELMAKLYLSAVKGVRVAEPRITGKFTTISELSVGEVSRIQVVVVQEVDRRSYVGCPRCMRKLQAAQGATVQCPRDGLVQATLLSWHSVLAGDSTGEIMLTFPPRLAQVPKVGETIAVEGTLTEQEEFVVYRFSPVVGKPLEERAEGLPLPVPPPAPTVTPPAPPAPPPPTVTAAPSPPEFKCSTCGRSFKSEQALRVHVGRAHGGRPAEAPKPGARPEVKVEAPPPEEAAFPKEAVRLARVAGEIRRPYEDFKQYISSRFPGIDVDGLIKAAGLKVENGVLVPEQ